jgi:hypothetical protein
MVYQNKTEEIGSFVPAKDSDQLEKENKYSFVKNVRRGEISEY